MAVQRRCGSSSKSFPTTIRYSEQAMIYGILLIGRPLRMPQPFLVPQAPLRARERGHRRPQHCSSAPEEPQGIKHLQACRSVLYGKYSHCMEVDVHSRCALVSYWVESFNHQLLIYLPKRIHFSTKVFNMRMSLALLDWLSLFFCSFLITHGSTYVYRMKTSTGPTPVRAKCTTFVAQTDMER